MQPLFLGNHPLIDFLNTALEPDGQPVELIESGTAYLEWLVAAGLLDKTQAASLAHRFGSKALDVAAAEARKVREWVRDWLTRWRVNPTRNYEEEVATLNKLLARDRRSSAVIGDKGDFRVVEVPYTESARALLGLIAVQLAALITKEQPELIKACASRTCTLWFLDRTKSHRRMFCSATACGNRAKVAAFRERRRE